jgi:hypothetical protein
MEMCGKKTKDDKIEEKPVSWKMQDLGSKNFEEFHNISGPTSNLTPLQLFEHHITWG